MSDQSIELSREGIKLSYLRFLSDSAAGQIVILVGILAYYYPIFGTPLKHGLVSEMSTEVKILVMVMLFLLSTPLGLAINALSWFLLSPVQLRLQGFWFSGGLILGKKLFKNLEDEFRSEQSKAYFKLSGDNWYARSQLVKQSLHIFFPNIPNSLDHIRGMRTLFRNISFLSLIFFPLVAGFRIYSGQLHFWTLSSLILTILCLILFIGPMLISSLLAYHYTSQILFRCYILALPAESLSNSQGFDKTIVSILRRASERNS